MTTLGDFLKRSITEKSAHNPRSSLRALARKAGLSPSHISRAINGESRISPAAAYKIATALELSLRGTRELIGLSNIDSLNSGAKEKLFSRSDATREKNVLDLELFEMISDWHYFAIFEWVKAQPKRARPLLIARKFGLDTVKVKLALDRVSRANLLTCDARGYYSATSSEGIYAGNDIPNAAVKGHHRQVSKKAIEAVDLPVTEREFQSLQIPFDRKRIKAAQECLRKFINDFEVEFACEEPTDVYQLNLQFFPLTHKENP